MSRRPHIDTTDGISIEYPEWRFNLRTSNTEPVVRLNVESRADTALMNEKTAELLNLLRGIGERFLSDYRYRGFILDSVKRTFSHVIRLAA
jgi:phosphomannomutase